MKKKILFFDDEKEIAENLQKNLELFGLDVTLVSTIRELFEEINAEKIYDLIIMDCMVPMPVLEEEINMFSQTEISQMDNGIKVGDILVDKIRRIQGAPKNYESIPVLFYSARLEVKLLGNTKHLRKPELAKTILNEINYLIEKTTYEI